jgi:hypothetical protein
MIDPASIIKLRANGTGDMATLADENPSPAFTHDRKFVLTAVLAWASLGTGAGVDITIYQKIRDRPDGTFDLLRRTLPTFSTDGTAFHDWRIDESEQHHWVLNAYDLWVPVWANPHSGTMAWALEFQIRSVE